jgi:autotransporter-associated beta strand protein
MPTTYTKQPTGSDLSLAAAWSPAGGPPSLVAEDVAVWSSTSLGGTLTGSFGAKGITFNGATANVTYNTNGISLGSNGFSFGLTNNRQFLFNTGVLGLSSAQTWSLYHTTSGVAALRITTANGLVGNFAVQLVNSSPSSLSLVAYLDLDRCSGWAGQLTLRDRTGLTVRGTSSAAAALPLATIILDGDLSPQLRNPIGVQAHVGSASGSVRILRSATFGGASTLNIYSPISIEGSSSITLTASTIVQAMGGLSGSAPLRKEGSSAFRLTYSPTVLPAYTGPLTVATSEFQESAGRAAFSSVQLLGGASQFSNIFQTADYTTPPISGAGNAQFDGNFTGNGVTVHSSSSLASVSLRAFAATFAGRQNTTINIGSLAAKPASIYLRASASAATPAISCRFNLLAPAPDTYASDIRLESFSNANLTSLSNGAYTLASSGAAPVTITGSVARINTAAGTSALMTLRLAGTNTDDNRIAGTVTEQGGVNNITLGLTKAEVGNWTLAGALSHTGPTTVEQGSLCLEAMSHDNTNTGAITVNSGAVLQLVTNDANPRRVTGTAPVTVNGTLRTGASAAASAVAKYGGALTFNSGSVLELGAA